MRAFGCLTMKTFGKKFAGLRACRFGEHFDRVACRVGVVVVELVGDLETRMHSLRDRMRGICDFHRVGAERVVAARTAADDLEVPFPEIFPRVPRPGMMRDDRAAAVRVGEQRLARRGGHGLVRAPQEHVHVVEDRRDASKSVERIASAKNAR